MTIGGAFFSAQLPPMGKERPGEVIRQNCIVWGTATLDATDNVERVDEGEEKRGSRRAVSFRVRYGEEPIRYPPGHIRKPGEKLKKTKFMLCRAVGFTQVAAVMTAVEKNDPVLCVGRTIYRKSKNRNGEPIAWYEMKTMLVLPMGLISFLMRLYNSKTIRDMLEAEDNADADVWESD